MALVYRYIQAKDVVRPTRRSSRIKRDSVYSIITRLRNTPTEGNGKGNKRVGLCVYIYSSGPETFQRGCISVSPLLKLGLSILHRCSIAGFQRNVFVRTSWPARNIRLPRRITDNFLFISLYTYTYYGTTVLIPFAKFSSYK